MARLPHLLDAESYVSPAAHAREQQALFEPSWHLVASLDDVPRDRDFVTVDLLGRPLLVQNARGEARVFSSSCAHRHTKLTEASRGSGPLRCQYHGWEYDPDGVVCKVPQGRCFEPTRRGEERLHRYPSERLGKLVFARLRDDGPSLRAQLGERVWALGSRWFGGDVRQAVSLTLDHPCNWKVVLENVLESYHVPFLHDNWLARHPEVFRFFRGAPPADAGAEVSPSTGHELGDGYTIVHDVLGEDSALYRGLLRAFRPAARTDFVHVHAFPSLQLGHTGVVSFVQTVTPITADTSRSDVRIFLDLGQVDRPGLERLVAPLADRLARHLFEQLMREDGRVFASVQQGKRFATHAGVLGSHEERIHRFHRYVVDRCR